MRLLESGCSLALGVVLVVSPASAGPLNPPPGPVGATGTFGPRIEINEVNTPGDADSQFRITSRGSYYLARNITGESGKSAIEIASRGVTIDLGGYEILGVSGATDGISIGFTSIRNIDISNGSFVNWPSNAIDVSDAEAVRISDISVDGGGGIYTGPRSIVSGCIIRNTVSSGLICEGESLVLDCVMADCAVSGLATFNNVTVLRTTIFGSGSIGVFAGGGLQMIECQVVNSGSLGIQTSSGCRIHSCVSRGNAITGIEVGNRSEVSDCVVISNGGVGIRPGGGSLVSGCTVSFNAEDGIRVVGETYVVGNMCADNGVEAVRAGIAVVGDGNRIEANSVMNNGVGIAVPGTNNLIIRNTARGNAGANNYDITGAFNDYGQILTNPGAGFVSSNPWANFAF